MASARLKTVGYNVWTQRTWLRLLIRFQHHISERLSFLNVCAFRAFNLNIQLFYIRIREYWICSNIAPRPDEEPKQLPVDGIEMERNRLVIQFNFFDIKTCEDFQVYSDVYKVHAYLMITIKHWYNPWSNTYFLLWKAPRSSDKKNVILLYRVYWAMRILCRYKNNIKYVFTLNTATCHTTFVFWHYYFYYIEVLRLVENNQQILYNICN